MKTGCRPDDRLGLARNILLGSWVATAALLGLMVLDSSLRSSREHPFGQPLVERLWLSNLSVVPSGRPFRNPQALHPGVDLRFSPLLPPVEAEPAGLLLTRPDPGFLEGRSKR
jgi:hypothetical protein